MSSYQRERNKKENLVKVNRFGPSIFSIHCELNSSDFMRIYQSFQYGFISFFLHFYYNVFMSWNSGILRNFFLICESCSWLSAIHHYIILLWEIALCEKIRIKTLFFFVLNQWLHCHKSFFLQNYEDTFRCV